MTKKFSQKSDNKRHYFGQWLHKKLDRYHFLQKMWNLTKVMVGSGIFYSVFTASSRSDNDSGPAVQTPPKSIKQPFQLGVASGDPLSDGVVLWTRLSPQPLIGGGMPSDPVDVKWEVSKDESFTDIVQQGTFTAKQEYGHSVHAEVDGLQSNSWYYYRFKMGEEVSPIGRTKTAPASGYILEHLNFAFASCQNFKDGHYTAYDHLVNEDLDLVFFLGDYIYEGSTQGSIGRGHLPQKEVRTLNEYRIRYGQYKSDPSLQAAHAAFPWIVTLDDHEIENNWGGEGPPYDNNEQFLARRAVALQAYYEHMPLRRSSMPEDINMQLYRRFRYGNLVEFNVLDTRQYRTDFACGGGNNERCSERFDPSRTMLGGEQEDWLFSGLTSSSTQWNVLAQQVMMAQMDRESGPGKAFSMDKWDGYTATRTRLFETIKNNNISNIIVLTGDLHRNFVCNLLEDFSDPASPILGTEFLGTSISSAGNGADITSSEEVYLEENPWMKFANRQRGYVRCQLTPEQLNVDFRVVPYVEEQGAPIHTRASFVVENGNPGAVQVQ